MLSIAIASLVLAKSGPVHFSDQVTLRFHPPVGKKYPFKMKMAMSMSFGPKAPPMEVTTSMDVVMAVLAASAGVTTMSTKISNAHVAMPPNSPMAGMKSSMEQQMVAKSVQMKIDTRYHISATSGLGADAALTNLQTLSFPEKAIKIGDEWGSSLDISKAMAGIMSGKTPGMEMKGSIPIRFKLERIGQGPKERAAFISLTMEGTMSMSMQGQLIPVTMHSVGNFIVDVATGMTMGMKVNSESSSKIGGNSMSQKMLQTMTLQ